MKTPSLIAPAILIVFAASCASTPADRKNANAADAAAAAKDDKDTDELQTKLDKATLKLEIARIDARNGEAALARSIEAATLEAELAVQALENFRAALQPI